MDDTYKTLKAPSKGQFKDKGSRFMAFAYPVTGEPEIKEILTELRKKYYDARHHCYAYKFNAENPVFRVNDDGEPSGTAGKPIYGQILSHGLTNILIVVVRYFGGVLLGTGGLTQAYKNATLDALKNAIFLEKTIDDSFEIYYTYNHTNEVMRLCHLFSETILDQQFGEKCTLIITVRKSRSEEFIKKLSLVNDVSWIMNKDNK